MLGLKEVVKYNKTSRRTLERIRDTVLNVDNTCCLDIGSGINNNKKWQTIDNRIIPIKDNEDKDTGKLFTPNYLIDVRAIFAPGYCDNTEIVNKYPDIKKIKYNYWDMVNMSHFVEHIEWIYQDFLFRWVFDLLIDGGFVYIDTPSLEYILGVYSENRKLQKRGKPVKYPVYEHEYLSKEIQSDMQKWIQYKLYSGCSPLDYHHCHYDAYFLTDILLKAGFTKINISNADVLVCIAYKPGVDNVTIEESIKRVVK